VRDDGIAATAVLGLPGFVVLAVSEYAGDPLFRIRRLLRRGHDHHNLRSWTRIFSKYYRRTRISLRDLRIFQWEWRPQEVLRRPTYENRRRHRPRLLRTEEKASHTPD
jgi:hypothetical protein